MKIKTNMLYLCVCFLIGVIIGGVTPEHPAVSLIMICIGLITLGVLVHILYVWTITNNMKLVEKKIKKMKDKPMGKYLEHVMRREFDQAYAVLLPYSNRRMYNKLLIKLKIIMLLNEEKVSEAKNVLRTLKSSTDTAYLHCYIAILEQDDAAYTLHKAKIKQKVVQLEIEADRLHHLGQMDKAEETAKQAITHARGVHKYILIHSLDHTRPEHHNWYF